MLSVELCCFGGVMNGVMMMAICSVGMVRGEMMIAGFVVARGFAMVAGRMLVVFCCFVVMLGCLLGHKVLLDR
jgi:hypothetical protein